MKIVVGTVIEKEGKILMVQESKKEFYGKWSLPTGHLEKGETIEDGAIRETFEETGCTVKLKSMLPITYDKSHEVISIHFIAELLTEEDILRKEEILDKKWFEIKDIINMSKDNLRYPNEIIEIIKNIRKKELYPLNVIGVVE